MKWLLRQNRMRIDMPAAMAGMMGEGRNDGPRGRHDDGSEHA